MLDQQVRRGEPGVNTVSEAAEVPRTKSTPYMPGKRHAATEHSI